METALKTTYTNEQDLNFIKGLVHGASGVGKTTSLGTLPESTTIIAISERGALPLRSKKYKAVRIEEWEDIRNLIRALHNGHEELAGFKTLAIDSLSNISEMCKKKILSDRRVVTSERTRGQRDTPEKIYDDQMTQEDWGIYKNRMSGLLTTICALPMNVVITSLSHWAKDQNTGESWLTPNLSGKLSLECPAFFDLVVYMESITDPDGENMRRFRFFEDQNVIAKDASGVNLPNYMEPDWSQVFKTIFEGGNQHA